jgi:hypothetical protein
MSEGTDRPNRTNPSKPPPFNPDLELIAHFELGGKPTLGEVRKMMSEPRSEILHRLRQRFSRVRADTSLAEELIADRRGEENQPNR